jgi:hypothetical protein
MKPLLTLTIVVIFLLGCARIPVQSVALADALQVEGERMHRLNLMLLNRIFSAKRETIETFIRDEYTPVVVAAFTRKVEKEAPNTDFKKEFPDLLNALSPEISKRRDSLVNALELQQEKLVDKLNTDYTVFNNAAFELRKLLESAVKVDRGKQALFDQAKALSDNRLDFNSIEGALDKFIHSAGSVGNNIHELNTFINQSINKK